VSDQAWLEAFVHAHGGIAGSVHRRVGPVLQATAFHQIPFEVQHVTSVIPPGKGMAGLAWLRGEPVSTCDLATDATGDVRPGARAVAAQAAVAVPVFEGDGLRAKRATAGASDDERLAEGQSEARTLRAKRATAGASDDERLAEGQSEARTLRAKRATAGASDDERLAAGQSESRTLRAVVGIAFAGPSLPPLAVLTAAAAHLPPTSGRD
jgi:L-methionine (R)-S-oxide reductase